MGHKKRVPDDKADTLVITDGKLYKVETFHSLERRFK